MTKVIEFTNAYGVYCKVEVDKENKIIRDTWTGQYGSPENFRKVIEAIKTLILEHKIEKWLADIRNLKQGFDSSQKWLNEIMDELIEAGLKKEAIIQPSNIAAKLSTKDAILKIKNFELCQFQDVTEAEKWLNS